jgi:hypothetical protein
VARSTATSPCNARCTWRSGTSPRSTPATTIPAATTSPPQPAEGAQQPSANSKPWANTSPSTRHPDRAAHPANSPRVNLLVRLRSTVHRHARTRNLSQVRLNGEGQPRRTASGARLCLRRRRGAPPLAARTVLADGVLPAEVGHWRGGGALVAATRTNVRAARRSKAS